MRYTAMFVEILSGAKYDTEIQGNVVYKVLGGCARAGAGHWRLGEDYKGTHDGMYYCLRIIRALVMLSEGRSRSEASPWRPKREMLRFGSA
jgi:hypothetical protein